MNRKLAFSSRNIKELTRDPLGYIFCVGFPLIMLVLMSIIDSSIPKESVTTFHIENLAPGVAVFGQMFVTKPGEKTWYKADNSDPWVYCWMTFGGNIAKDCLEKAGFSDGVNNLNCNVSQQRFHSLVERVLDEAKLKPSNIYFRTGMLLEYISAAIDSNYMSGEKNRRPAEYHSDLYVDYAVNMIQENYASITISEVAKNIGIHRSYLTGIFKKKVGVSPQEFLLQCRIRQACKLLTETNNPIQEIARQVGYDNPLTFSKTFKTFCGVSPRSYREHKAKTE